jgi:hypothetical protein
LLTHFLVKCLLLCIVLIDFLLHEALRYFIGLLFALLLASSPVHLEHIDVAPEHESLQVLLEVAQSCLEGPHRLLVATDLQLTLLREHVAPLLVLLKEFISHRNQPFAVAHCLPLDARLLHLLEPLLCHDRRLPLVEEKLFLLRHPPVPARELLHQSLVDLVWVEINNLLVQYFLLPR